MRCRGSVRWLSSIYLQHDLDVESTILGMGISSYGTCPTLPVLDPNVDFPLKPDLISTGDEVSMISTEKRERHTSERYAASEYKWKTPRQNDDF